MKVTVLGAGAIGSMLGALIKNHEPEMDVVLMMRGEHGQATLDQGTIRLDGDWGTYDVPVRVSFDAEDVAGSDFLLCTVKSQDTEDAIRSVSDHLGEAIVISIQNGINDDVMLRYVPRERVVMGMTATNMAVLKPGSVSLQLGGTTMVGPHADSSNLRAASAAADLLRKTRLEIDEHENILGIRYNKLAMNALGYASCLSAANFITDAICHRGWRATVGRPIIDECIDTFQAAGIELAKIPGRPDVRGIRGLLKKLDLPIVGAFIGMAAKRIYNKKPIVFSLYQDLKRGKKTEVEYINGHVVELARQHGLDAPFNQQVVEITHELESRGAASFLSRDEVIQRFRSLKMQAAQAV